MDEPRHAGQQVQALSLSTVPREITAGAAEVRSLFYAGALDAAAAAGRRLLDEAFAATPDRSSDPQAVADAAIWLVRIARRQERFDEALRNANIALTAALTCGDARRECVARMQHARVLSAIGETQEALDESYASLRAAVVAGDARLEAVGLEALADVQWSMAQWDDALATFGRMLGLAEGCADLELQAVAHGGLGGVHHHLGVQCGSTPAPAAVAHFREAAGEALAFQRCARQVGDLYNARTAAHNHAIALMALGDTAGARAGLQQLLNEADDASGVRALTLKNLGDVDFLEGRREDATAHYREALAASEEQQQVHVSMACCEALVTACEAIGDLAGALAHHRRFHALYVQVASESAQAHARAMAVRFETEQAQAGLVAQRARADRLESSNSSLSLEAERLVRMSQQDALTGIGNRRHFDQALLTAGTEPTRRFSLALLDIDHFKRVNDLCSHPIGDAVLRRIGAILAASSRRDDVAARYGGEEFALILTGLDAAAARAVCERVRLAVEGEDWSPLHPLLQVTISIGVAHHAGDAAPMPVQALLALADRRLYAAKGAGRNRVVDTGSEPTPPAAGLRPAASS